MFAFMAGVSYVCTNWSIACCLKCLEGVEKDDDVYTGGKHDDFEVIRNPTAPLLGRFPIP